MRLSGVISNRSEGTFTASHHGASGVSSFLRSGWVSMSCTCFSASFRVTADWRILAAHNNLISFETAGSTRGDVGSRETLG